MDMADRRSPQPDSLASMPLPPGWEAKYDFTQRRYFFIDHQSKVTTWMDPRLKQQHPPHSGVAQLSSDHRPARHSPTPTGQHGKSTASGWQSQVEDKYGMKVEIIKDDGDVDPEAASRIMLRFPTVGKELVTMVSADCSSEEDVCQKLRDMGYREATPSTGAKTAGSGGQIGLPLIGTKSPSYEKLAASSAGAKAPSSGLNIRPPLDQLTASPSSKHHARRTSPDRSITPKNVALNNTSDKRSASPARPSKSKGSGHKSHTAGGQASAKASPLTEPSSDKKKRMQEKLEQEFKSQDKSIVEATLVLYSYDEEKARCQLQVLSIPKSTSKTANTTTTTVAPSVGADASQATQMNSSAAAAAADADADAAAAAFSALALTDAHESSETIANDSNSSEHSGYASPLRQETRGPNASLAKGPNKQLLLSDYIVEVGSQSSNYHGPCKENYHGPSAELQKGHQPGIDKGPASLYSITPD